MTWAVRSLAGVALLAACASTPAPPAELFPHLPQADVAVTTASATYRFRVWIAADDPSRARGLMFVRELPAERGMLFLFDVPQPAAFWMKNTYVSLDLVFIDPAGRVLNIAPDTRPFSLAPIESNGPVVAVLELAAGSAARMGLASGDRVSLPGWPAASPSDDQAPPGVLRHPDRF